MIIAIVHVFDTTLLNFVGVRGDTIWYLADKGTWGQMAAVEVSTHVRTGCAPDARDSHRCQQAVHLHKFSREQGKKHLLNFLANIYQYTGGGPFVSVPNTCRLGQPDASFLSLLGLLRRRARHAGLLARVEDAVCHAALLLVDLGQLLVRLALAAGFAVELVR